MIYLAFGLAIFAALIGLMYGGKCVLVGILPNYRFRNAWQLWYHAFLGALGLGVGVWLFHLTIPVLFP
jgi:hypothetical protein